MLSFIPKVLAQNSGYDPQETLLKLQTEYTESGQLIGVDLSTGEPMVAGEAGVWDNYSVKKQLLHSCTVIASNILLVDEIMRAGMSSLRAWDRVRRHSGRPGLGGSGELGDAQAFCGGRQRLPTEEVGWAA
ncbi:T-complex protein 1 subunit zeta [Lates japonicus]|uniref:T-complex protein 1 subunit zeta n=1 Tax=Lates japonicus TaxID=270547 RepID=A0AAD3M448_LATJO|nr:T-complex protein 1 subunit zeta [Lates japonicus]